MATISDASLVGFGAYIRQSVTSALEDYVDAVIKELIATAQKRIETEARDYAARTVLTLSHVAEIREMRDRIVIELRLPPKDGQ